LHQVFRVSFDGSGRYRIEEALPAGRSSRNFGGTIVGDRERQWWLDEDEWLAYPGGPPPHEIGKLLDPSWLLEHRLTGGAETTVGGRRGYRFAVAADAPMDGFLFSVDDVVADAELGILLARQVTEEARSAFRNIFGGPRQQGGARHRGPW
jgi:hypothetical protein